MTAAGLEVKMPAAAILWSFDKEQRIVTGQ